MDRKRQEVLVWVEGEHIEPVDFKESTQTHLAFAMKWLVKTDPQKSKSSTLLYLPKPLSHANSFPYFSYNLGIGTD